VQFYRLAIGARFEAHGRQFEKLGMSLAEDSARVGTLFLGGTEVAPIGEPLLLSEAEAEYWKPLDRHWTEFLDRAPTPLSELKPPPQTPRPRT
jgi:hypothetical protein